MAQAPMQGIPNPYPLAINTPLDRAYLRPLQEPLYDSEVLNPAAAPNSLTYYQRPISQSTAALNMIKTEAETNINQSSMLDYPREFSILGFNVTLDSTIGMKSAAEIYRRAWFSFTFSGRRPYLQIPLERIPHGVGIEGALATTAAADGTHSGILAQGKNGMGHIANYYKFNLGRSALKIKPGEAFNAKINFPQAILLDTTLNNDFGMTVGGPLTVDPPAGWWVRVYTVGLNWSPL
jgi:hypothetical protein